MVHILSRQDFKYPESRTAAFEGRPFGANVSFFIVDEDPGQGPGLHQHEYPETWIIQEGVARFTIDGNTLMASDGNIVVVPARTPHKFVCSGNSPLKMICIHANPIFEQTDLAD